MARSTLVIAGIAYWRSTNVSVSVDVSAAASRRSARSSGGGAAAAARLGVGSPAACGPALAQCSRCEALVVSSE